MTAVVRSPFRPAWWLPGGHLQTLWPSLFRARPPLALEPERLELADGDFLDLAWCGPEAGPPVLLLHGLEGDLHSHYARPTLAALCAAGYRTCFMHFRGCSGEPNRLPRSYHSGETGDLETVAGHVAGRCGRPLHGAVGFSLGGNVLLKWLGERGDRAPLQRAVAVSVPYRLGDAASRLERGLSRLYQRHLIARLQAHYREKFARIPSPLQVDVGRLRSFRAFDDRVTAPLHGFQGVDDYYARCSSRRFLGAIRVPTLLIHALDDPFMYPDTIPRADELAASVTLEVSRGGGHVGFVGGRLPWRPDYWLDRRIPAWLGGADA